MREEEGRLARAEAKSTKGADMATGFNFNCRLNVDASEFIAMLEKAEAKIAELERRLSAVQAPGAEHSGDGAMTMRCCIPRCQSRAMWRVELGEVDYCAKHSPLSAKPIKGDAALSAVRAFEPIRVEVAKLELKPRDRVLLKVKARISENQRRIIRSSLEHDLPGNKVIVLDNSMDLAVIGAEDPRPGIAQTMRLTAGEKPADKPHPEVGQEMEMLIVRDGASTWTPGFQFLSREGNLVEVRDCKTGRRCCTDPASVRIAEPLPPLREAASIQITNADGNWTGIDSVKAKVVPVEPQPAARPAENPFAVDAKRTKREDLA